MIQWPLLVAPLVRYLEFSIIYWFRAVNCLDFIGLILTNWFCHFGALHFLTSLNKFAFFYVTGILFLFDIITYSLLRYPF